MGLLPGQTSGSSDDIGGFRLSAAALRIARWVRAVTATVGQARSQAGRAAAGRKSRIVDGADPQQVVGGGDDTRPAPKPATTCQATTHEDHELLLE